ncbi:CRISPR-associated endonuclease Cas2 [Candidatus Giovannonibacteria bacterium RIFCSPHIGHO2_02_43_13]|uniref:CRISPR-associated endonuclease Cas2 n=1 Tax=Candidatus Giovannonibacteria bacterium RIFCSPHIGHO2_02_43_13 TaxID=1798330 RepID=A0A1F5WS10_9BACT|nr:MAG: CRISPR-associated endonuclease Cas2 [Candidatus Giovannonibacteria bacterium RIFCSPHIGHO2_12_FULL_44_42]OGF78449.1 MAG: CRISPR-associated endonuclease Cas2 [Candidatus Giovannonibacteria bacterium RIFCSPHIGHO2_02_43_13]OGF88651.1 MAG: CRISPR-associated endonuclease Cas2 [Candidatus Giovannonibacteria bacterium RIFCSPLOWO2_02_FULL_43_54]OGF97566.1 MAG: CRISPR-associated endonuclease Cas2 [Candidatus Giovannonibacteria bacterium RIFCSPLOWO2_12_FULL_44_32]
MKKYSKLKIGPVSQKVLLILLAGAALGLTRSPTQYFRIIKNTEKEWGRINRRALHNAIRKLYKAGLIDSKDNKDDSITIFLTQNGKKKALTYKLDEISIPVMKKWDGNWHIVLFDIPEKHKKGRNALSQLLKHMGFYRFQKSVFIHPFECQNEVDFVVEFFSLRPYVRFILAKQIDNELHLKHHFGL